MSAIPAGPLRATAAASGGRPAAGLGAAYAYCEAIAWRHYENFPVASRLVPAGERPHIAAVYAFARRADDFADEGWHPAGERHRLLDEWVGRLRESAAGDVADGPDALLFRALGHTIRTCGLPLSLFEDLVSAFRQDITTTRYSTWDELFDYCRRSANPVGRLVLRIAGYRAARLDSASDAICTALQLANFWQDLAIDWRRGRLYVPREVWESAGASPDDLNLGTLSPEWRLALRASVRVTRALFAEGRGLCDEVVGRLRYELRLTWLGGSRILDKLEAGGFDVFRARPTVGWRDLPALGWRLARWRRHAA